MIVLRLVIQVSKRGLALTATRRADQVMPDPVEHATGKIIAVKSWKKNSQLAGLEKYELLAKLAGNEDPFFLRAVTRGKVWITSSIQTLPHTCLFPGHQGKPNHHQCDGQLQVVDSNKKSESKLAINCRMVGCVCAEEDTNIKWTWLSEVFVVTENIVCVKKRIPEMCPHKLCGYSDLIFSDLSKSTIGNFPRVLQRGVSADSGWNWSPTLPQTSWIHSYYS